MSAFIPPTPDGGEFVPDIDRANEDMAEDFRLLAFHAYVGEIHGQAGELLRVIADVLSDYEEARRRKGTTEGECDRMAKIRQAAMSTLERLRAGEQS